MNLLTIQLVDDTSNPQPGGGAVSYRSSSSPAGGGGGGGGGGGSAFAGNAAGQRLPGGSSAPGPAYQSAPAGGGSKAAKIQRILSHPAAKGLKLSANILAAMGDDYLDQLDRELGGMNAGGSGGSGGAGAGPQSPKAESARPTPPDPANEADDWYARYRELQNRFDRYQEEGKRLADVEMAELERLRARLTEEANKPAGGAAPGPAGAPPEDEPGYGRTRFRGNGPDAPLPSWLTDEQRAGLEQPGPGYRVVPPGEKNADFIKRNIPKGIGSALEGAGIDVAGTANKLGGMTAAVDLGKLAAAAGPAAVALTAAEAASRLLQKGLTKAGDMAVDLAGNRHMGALTAAADAAKIGLMAFPIVGPMAAGAIKTLVPVVKEYEKVAAAFVQRGQELAKYSADLAGAGARASVRSTLADVRESQALGPALTKLTDNQSQADANLRELFLPIKEMLAEALAAGSGVVKEITGIAKDFAPVIKFLTQVATFIPINMLRLLGEVIRWFHEALQHWPFNIGRGDNEPQDGELNTMMQSLFESINRIPNPAAAGHAPAAAFPRVL